MEREKLDVLIANHILNRNVFVDSVKFKLLEVAIVEMLHHNIVLLPLYLSSRSTLFNTQYASDTKTQALPKLVFF